MGRQLWKLDRLPCSAPLCPAHKPCSRAFRLKARIYGYTSMTTDSNGAPMASQATEPDRTSDDQPAAHSWAPHLHNAAAALRVLIAAEYVAPASAYSGLFRVSRAGRDWVLSTAPHARLTLKPPPDPDSWAAWRAELAEREAQYAAMFPSSKFNSYMLREPAAFLSHAGWRAQLAAVQRALAVRGQLPSTLEIHSCFLPGDIDSLNNIAQVRKHHDRLHRIRTIPCAHTGVHREQRS